MLQSDSEVDASERIKQCSTPKLIAAGSLEEMDFLALVAEGMVVVKFRSINMVNALICLLAAYYVFNAEYPKGHTGHNKNIYILLEHLLLGKSSPTYPIYVENFLSQM